MQLDLFLIRKNGINLSSVETRKSIIEDLEKRMKFKRELFYTTEEVSRMLNLSYFQVFYLCKWFRLVGVKIHNLTRIPVTEIIEYLEDYNRIDELESAFYEWLRTRGGGRVA
jgi:hypothetical protein